MYNVVELFSGIGSQARALENIGTNINIVGTCEWDVHAIIAYDLLHNSPEIPESINRLSKEKILELLKGYTFSNSGKEALDFDSLRTYSYESLKRLYTAITRNQNFVDVTAMSGLSLSERIDILTYSFPCQDLSNVGAFHGYNKGIDKNSGSRSSLLWQVGRILLEMKDLGNPLPRFLVMENVPALLSYRHFPNFSAWISDLRKLGYVSQYYELNASEFGVPQNRPRLIMLSVLVSNDENMNAIVLDYFRYLTPAGIVEDYKKSPYFHDYAVSDFLRTDYTNTELLEEAIECTPNDTISRRKIWDENPQIVLPGNKINQEIKSIRTITTKQDRNPNSGNLFFESGVPGKGSFRYLTPRECMLFMGFTDEDYERLKANNIEFHSGDHLFSRDKIIRLSGNSIPVKMLEGVFLQVRKIDMLLLDFNAHCHHGKWDKEHEAYISKTKSALFRRGIRSRIAQKAVPKSADIVYPHYKTAVYICDCFLFGHDCNLGDLPENNREFWSSKIDENKNELNEILQEAIQMGWNTLILWTCQLDDTHFEKTMDNVVSYIRGENLDKFAG